MMTHPAPLPPSTPPGPTGPGRQTVTAILPRFRKVTLVERFGLGLLVAGLVLMTSSSVVVFVPGVGLAVLGGVMAG